MENIFKGFESLPVTFVIVQVIKKNPISEPFILVRNRMLVKHSDFNSKAY